MTGRREEPFGRAMTEAEAQIVMRNRVLGWDAAGSMEGADQRPPRRESDPIVIAVYIVAAGTLGGLFGALAFWVL